MEIKSHFKKYHVDFVDSLADLERLSKEKETYFVIDRNVYSHYQNELPTLPQDRLTLLDAIESGKTIDTALAICEKMTAMPAKRNTHLVSVGGGITQDITGFVASNLYRGIAWTFYPTTLLAMCDSCIGGKSSLNYKGFKNLLGSFYPPDRICIFPDFCKTLTEHDYESGLGEVVKFNVIAGREDFSAIEHDFDRILAHDYTLLRQYIQKSLFFKKNFIEQDEFDHGVRVLLNYAHTFGHAIEVGSQYVIPHGSAVALGMMIANNISVQRGYFPRQEMERVESVCKRILTTVDLTIEYLAMPRLLNAIHKDKKQTSEAITAVLINSKGELQVFHDVQEEEIRKAVNHLAEVMGVAS